MIHLQDQDSLHRMLGTETISEAVEEEYQLRQQWFHADGASGPLGPLALIAMLRQLGYRPVPREPDYKPTAWHLVPQDGTARVEARFRGQWMPGTFLHFIEAGTLGVRLDEEDVVRECRPHMVRLLGSAYQGEPAVDDEPADPPPEPATPTPPPDDEADPGEAVEYQVDEATENEPQAVTTKRGRRQ